MEARSEMVVIKGAVSSLKSFCLDFLVMYQNGLIKKIRLISDFMTSQPG